MCVCTGSPGAVRAGSAQDFDFEAGISPLLPDNPDTAALGVFPFCQCDDYRCASGPYRLEFDGIEPSGSSTTDLCWKIVRVRARGKARAVQCAEMSGRRCAWQALQTS